MSVSTYRQTRPWLGPNTIPTYLEENGYIHYDYGGNAGGPEVSLMILDHYLYTQNASALARYFPIII